MELMELELGLALPNHSPMTIQGLDLNCNSNGLETENRKDYSQKRVLLEDRAVGVESTNLSLFLCSGVCRRPEEEDGGGHPPKWRKIHVDDDDDDCEEIEGWPPINSSWKELPRRRLGGSSAAEQLRKSMHVKVKMEGVAIGRKVDLRHYDSYQALTNTLIDMFAKCTSLFDPLECLLEKENCRNFKILTDKIRLNVKFQRFFRRFQHILSVGIDLFSSSVTISCVYEYADSKIDTNMEEYTLSYQDKEGDWMLVGDVQWEMFVESVQRVEIIKNDNKMGFRLLSRKS